MTLASDRIVLSVIIVTHNHAAYIGACLQALLPEAKQVEAEVIVVDNRSDDASAVTASQYSDVQVLVAPHRQGFSANCNLGMAQARGRYMLLLNPDTEVLPGALRALMTFMDAHPQVGMCGAQLLYPDGRIQPSFRRFPTLASVLVRRTPLRLVLRDTQANRHHLMLDDDHTTARPVDWLLGACMCVRRSTVDHVGPLDEGYFLYVEDIDWARRMHAAGWQIYYVPTAHITHHHLAVSDKYLISKRTLVHTRSMFRYARKFLLPSVSGLRITGYEDTVWRIALHHNQINQCNDEGFSA